MEERSASSRATTTTNASGTTGSGSGQSGSEEWTVRRLLAWTTPYLRERGVESPRTIVEILLSEVLEVERLRLYMEPDRLLSKDELARLRGLVARAGRHEPVQFLVGRWPFFGRDFEVAPCTLIPRPATETLVERALEWYRARGGGDAEVLDLCTGSGCVAISFLLGARAIARPHGAGCRPLRPDVGAGIEVARPSEAGATAVHAAGATAVVPASASSGETARAANAEPAAQAGEEPPSDRIARGGTVRVLGTDIVGEAVELARRNAERLSAPVEFRSGDLWSAVPEEAHPSFDAVLSNPPYVTDAEFDALDANVREYEPASALRGGPDGLDLVRRIVAQAARRVRAGGLLAIEVGWKHGPSTRALLEAGPWGSIRVDKDHEGIDRVVSAIRADD
jgi:release factor glutamine methyltransferase